MARRKTNEAPLKWVDKPRGEKWVGKPHENQPWVESIPQEVLYERMQRGRTVLDELKVVLTQTYDRQNVTDIARRLRCSRDKVRWMQHVLQLRTEKHAGSTNGKGKGVGCWPLPPDDDFDEDDEAA